MIVVESSNKSNDIVTTLINALESSNIQTTLARTAIPAQETQVVTKVVPAQKPTGRQPLPAHLQREDVILEPGVDTKGLKKIGEEVTEQLDYKPGKLIVKRFIRPKYARVSIDGTGYTEVFIAELPDLPLRKVWPQLVY